MKNKMQDDSLYIYQRDKVKETFNIRELKWTEKQQRFIDLALAKNTKVIICESPPGTGKTLLSLYCSLRKLNDKRIGEIIYIRAPIESCSKGLGFIPGSQEEKMNPYFLPAMDHFYELLDKITVKKLLKEERITVTPMGFLKGRTYSVCACIADEAEDLTLQELELLMGRMGHFSCLFIIGDEKQANIKNSGFSIVYQAFNNEESKSHGIHTFTFGKEDCMRNGISKYVIDIFETLR